MDNGPNSNPAGAAHDCLPLRHPQLAPALAALCHPLGCAVQPYRRLEAIVIDSSSFNREGPNAFRFSLTLRNSAGLLGVTLFLAELDGLL